MRKLTPLAIRRRIAKLKRTARELGIECSDTDSHDIAELVQAEVEIAVAIARHGFQKMIREQNGFNRWKEFSSGGKRSGPDLWGWKTLGWNSSASQQITNG